MLARSLRLHKQTHFSQAFTSVMSTNTKPAPPEPIPKHSGICAGLTGGFMGGLSVGFKYASRAKTTLITHEPPSMDGAVNPTYNTYKSCKASAASGVKQSPSNL